MAMHRPRSFSALAIALLLASCNFPGAETPPANPPPPQETIPPAATSPLPSEPPALPSPPALPEEAILILDPGPGSRLVDTIHIEGIADTTFEQNLGIRILLDDGSLLTQTSVIIDTELGNRGPFTIDVPFTIAGERNAFVQVFSASPRDGGITHLNSVVVTLAEAGPVNVVAASPHPEDINITIPAGGAMISGGVVHVEGIGIASFEQTLVVTVYDADGTSLASLPLIVNAPDFGLPGTFSVDLPYVVGAEQPGRITVIDPSAAFAGENHLASVEITLAP
jgi:hypothetical protein